MVLTYVHYLCTFHFDVKIKKHQKVSHTEIRRNYSNYILAYRNFVCCTSLICKTQEGVKRLFLRVGGPIDERVSVEFVTQMRNY